MMSKLEDAAHVNARSMGGGLILRDALLSQRSSG
jgi:hypothetical protein